MKQLEKIVKENWIYYLAGAVILLAYKYGFSRANASSLLFLLAPTALWAQVLSGIPFTYDAGVGFLNHEHRFIIAPSCSGTQFMLITAAVLIFSHMHQLKNIRRKNCYLGLSLLSSYLLTILVNGIRITLAILIPLWLEQAGYTSDQPAASRLHTLIGITVYFSSLLLIDQGAGYLIRFVSGLADRYSQVSREVPSDGKRVRPPFRMVSPLFFYFLFTLLIPLLNSAGKNNAVQFIEYSVTLIVGCMGILLLFWGAEKLCRFIVKR